MSSSRKPAAGSAQALPLPEDWESGARRPWVGFFFFFNYYYLSNGESIEILVSPFLLFVTNSHGSVFSVLFFFSVFFKKKKILSPLLGDEIGHLNKVLF